MSSNLRQSLSLCHSESIAPFWEIQHSQLTLQSHWGERVRHGYTQEERLAGGICGVFPLEGVMGHESKEELSTWKEHGSRAPSCALMTVLERISYTPVWKEEAGGSKPLEPQNMETDGETPTGNRCPCKTATRETGQPTLGLWGIDHSPTYLPSWDSNWEWRGKAGFGKGGRMKVFTFSLCFWWPESIITDSILSHLSPSQICFAHGGNWKVILLSLS